MQPEHQLSDIVDQLENDPDSMQGDRLEEAIIEVEDIIRSFEDREQTLSNLSSIAENFRRYGISTEVLELVNENDELTNIPGMSEEILSDPEAGEKAADIIEGFISNYTAAGSDTESMKNWWISWGAAIAPLLVPSVSAAVSAGSAVVILLVVKGTLELIDKLTKEYSFSDQDIKDISSLSESMLDRHVGKIGVTPEHTASVFENFPEIMEEVKKGLEDPVEFDRKKAARLFDGTGLHMDPEGKSTKVSKTSDWEIIENRETASVKGWDGDKLADAIEAGLEYRDKLRRFAEYTGKRIKEIKEEQEEKEEKDKDEIEDVDEETKEKTKRNIKSLAASIKAVNRKSRPVLEGIFKAGNDCLK